MGQPAARKNDPVVGIDIHVVMVPAPSGAVPTPLPHPFSGTITGGTIGSVKIGGKAAARMGDAVKTCNDPADADTSAIVSGESSVMIG